MPANFRLHDRHAAAERYQRRSKLPAVVAALAGRSTPKVALAGKLTAWAAPGGGEIQMAALARTLGEAGVDARLWRPWEESLSEFDCLHLFGSEPEHLTLAREARRHNIPVVLSTIAWFDLASCWREPWPLAKRLTACGKFALRAAAPWLRSWRRDLYHAVDLLLPNSKAEAAQLTRYFGVPAERIHATPNGADRRFSRGDSEPFARRVGGRGFALYPGRIEPRKNQLNFLLAMRETTAPVVILGDAVPGHEAYYARCRHAANRYVTFVERVEHNDPLLASAYAAAGCLVLASWYETPSLAALEAGMSGVPLVLPRSGCAQEYFGKQARYVSPGDLKGIRDATLAAMNRGRSLQLAARVRQNFSWRAAALATREAYEKVL
ncbi:MAG TPA: glycosyltransferase [Pirellulales bacterium]|nr:glycosyltransferase [Pirellulales bacterium]